MSESTDPMTDTLLDQMKLISSKDANVDIETNIAEIYHRMILHNIGVIAPGKRSFVTCDEIIADFMGEIATNFRVKLPLIS